MSDRNIKGIVFSDFDGTILYNAEGLIPEKTLEALSLIKKNGYLFVLSTGRDMDTHYSIGYLDKISPDAIIHSNGSKITIEGRPLFNHYMDMDLVKRLYRYCEERGYCIGTSIGDSDYFVNPEKKYKADKSYKKVVKRNFVPYEEVFRRGLKVITMSYCGNVALEKPIVEAAFPEIELYPFAGGIGADVVEKGYTKAEGFRRICSYYGIDRSLTYAIGDSYNDVPILKAAGTGIAMGNADTIALMSADYVTDRVENNGFYKAMEHFGLI